MGAHLGPQALSLLPKDSVPQKFLPEACTRLPEQFYLWQNHQGHIMALAQALKNRLNTLVFWLIQQWGYNPENWSS